MEPVEKEADLGPVKNKQQLSKLEVEDEALGRMLYYYRLLHIFGTKLYEINSEVNHYVSYAMYTRPLGRAI